MVGWGVEWGGVGCGGLKGGGGGGGGGGSFLEGSRVMWR